MARVSTERNLVQDGTSRHGTTLPAVLVVMNTVSDACLEALGDFIVGFEQVQTVDNPAFHGVRLVLPEKAIAISAERHDYRLYVALQFPSPAESEWSWTENFALSGRKLITLDEVIQLRHQEPDKSKILKSIRRSVNPESPSEVARMTSEILQYLPELFDAGASG